MPPTPIEPTIPSVSDTTKTCPWYQPLCQVTPISKYLALIIFIALPFVGGYIGYRLAPEKVVEVSVVATTPTPASLVTDTLNSSSTLRYILPGDWNEYVQDESNFKKVLTLADVHVTEHTDPEAVLLKEPYFLELLATTTDYMFFCVPPFGKEGTCNGLVRYSIVEKTVETMEVSDMYNPYYTSGALSPDKTKIALVPEYDSATGWSEVGYINLIKDTYIPLQKSDSKEGFLTCDEMGNCNSKIKWLNNNEFTIETYPICIEGISCVATSSSLKTFNVKL